MRSVPENTAKAAEDSASSQLPLLSIHAMTRRFFFAAFLKTWKWRDVPGFGSILRA